MHINGIEEIRRGPSFWKFNSSLLEDEVYIKLVTDKYSDWLEEGKDLQDPRVLWDFIKYKIRYETITYSKQKARNRREKLSALEEKIKECTVKCGEYPSPENLNDLEILQTEYDRQYEYIAQGAIIRSRASGYEYGEKSNKYFLNLENYKKKSSCIRKLVVENDECTTDPKQIMSEIHNFYANLYHTDSRERGGLSIDEYLRNINTNMLTDEQRELLDNKITTSEYFEALKSFQKNKTPGNDGLTVEFYLGFWHLVGKCYVDALNCAHEKGQLAICFFIPADRPEETLVVFSLSALMSLLILASSLFTSEDCSPPVGPQVLFSISVLISCCISARCCSNFLQLGPV